MSPERWQRVKQLFATARDRSGAERLTVLAQGCRDDDALREEIAALLSEYDALQDFLSSSVRPALSGVPMTTSEASIIVRGVRLAAGADGGQNAAELPPRIGQYRILRVLGQGGMGTVYLAEQENPRRTVALKVLHSGIASRDAVRRFELEAHVLARLQHPGIAQIYEAGTAGGGAWPQPFFAMELVAGLPLTEYAARAGLDLRHRLELFIKVCDAVQHAHQKGVIHRDLKPANILVVNDREQETGNREQKRPGYPPVPCSLIPVPSGQPKILDFGVARATNADMPAATLHTGVGHLVGTIPYMSPEQAAGDPHELDTRADVYALGVVLYELLAERCPYELAGTTIPEALRIITERDALPLGAAKPALQGDPEAIVARALEKDKTRRYQSASDLAADLARYLRQEPVSARPLTTFYQIRKFVRRNAVPVAGVFAGYLHSLALKKDGVIVAWGDNTCGQCALPAPNTGFVALAAGERHSLGLKADGSIVGWGGNDDGQLDVPPPNANFVAIAAGEGHSVGLKADGSVVAWGRNDKGQLDVPSPSADFVAIAANIGNSYGLKADGSIVCWGDENAHKLEVPPPNANFVGIAAGGVHSLGLKADGEVVSWGLRVGTVPVPNGDYSLIAAGVGHDLAVRADGTSIAWGSNRYGQLNGPQPNAGLVAVAQGNVHTLGLRSTGEIVSWGTEMPQMGGSDYVDIAAGLTHGLGLKADGTIRAVGHDGLGRITVPTPNEDFTAIAAGWGFSLALKADGSIVAWGSNDYGRLDVPAPNMDFVAVAAGWDHSLGLKADGSVIAWGRNQAGQLDVPSPNADFVAISAGRWHSVGLKADGSTVAWGCGRRSFNYGQCDAPTPNTEIVDIAAGGDHNLALRADGRIVAWGNDALGQLDVPQPNSGFTAIAAGAYRSVAVRSGYDPCDCNCDGVVDAFDIEPFIDLPLSAFPCSPCAGDVDGNGRVDAFDIEPFIECLLSQP